MPDATGTWLRRNALEHLTDLFRDNRIEFDTLDEISESDLAALDVKLGDRKAFVKAQRRDFRADVVQPQRRAGLGRAGTTPEWRVLTIVFVDLVGSTPLSLRVDAEDLHEILAAYLGRVTEITKAFGGHVVKYLGDGAMCVFGWPSAYEDHAERSVMMAAEVISAVRKLSTRPDLDLEVRIGISTGTVVVGLLGQAAEDVTGPATNLAQRLQTYAQPGKIVVDSTTAALLPDRIKLASLGAPMLKGFAEPVEALRVESVDDRARRSPGATWSEKSIVGRKRELTALAHLWSKAAQGSGSSAVIEGEAGIGKTRLVREACRTDDPAPHLLITVQCFEYRSQSAMYPLQQELKRSAGFNRNDGRSTRRAKLSGFLRGRCSDHGLALALLSISLDIHEADDEACVERHVIDRTRALVDLFVDLTLTAARTGALIFVIEDMHWADPSTRSFARALCARLAKHPILLLATTRPEWTGWPDDLPGANVVRLAGLERDASHRIIDATTKQQLSPTVLDAILQRADDNPLYLQELALVAADSSSGDDLPISIRSSMLARIDRLGKDKQILQFLAVLGPTFSLKAVREGLDLPDPEIRAALARLVDADILATEERAERPRYLFRHALIQEAAYSSLLRRTRIEMHTRVADQLLAKRSDGEFFDIEILARHLSLAERPAEAVPLWQAAGDRLAAQSAHAEAAQHYEKGLADVAKRKGGAKRDGAEYALRVRLAAALLAVEGWSAPRVAQSYERALHLSTRLGDPHKRFVALRGRFNVRLLRGELTAARGLVEELHEVARRCDDPILIAEGFKIDGGCAVHEAEFEHAAACLERSIGAAGPSSDNEQPLVFGTDLVVIALAHLAWVRWFLGSPDEADRNLSKALEVAHAGQHAFSEAYAEGFASCLRQFEGDADRALAHADNVTSLSERYHFHYFEGWGRIMRGWSVAFGGDPTVGLAELDKGISIYRETGAELILPYAYALRTEVRRHARTNAPSDGFGDAVQEGTSCESRFYPHPRRYRRTAGGRLDVVPTDTLARSHTRSPQAPPVGILNATVDSC